MPIDPSIPLGVQPFVPPDFQAARQRQMTLQALARQNRQGAQSEQDDRRERDKARRLEQALHGATTPAQIVEAYRSVDPYKALEIEASFTKQKREQAKADADLKNTTTTTSKNEAEIHKAHRARVTEDLGVFLTDPEAASAYPSWRAAEIADDPDAGQHLPEQFDPERLAAIQAALTETPATKRQLAEQKWRETVQFPAEERHRREVERLARQREGRIGSGGSPDLTPAQKRAYAREKSRLDKLAAAEISAGHAPVTKKFLGMDRLATDDARTPLSVDEADAVRSKYNSQLADFEETLTSGRAQPSQMSPPLQPRSDDEQLRRIFDMKHGRK